MRFKKFEFMDDWRWLFVIPTIAINKNEPIYAKKNFRFSMHWLGWHFSLQWMEDEDESC